MIKKLLSLFKRKKRSRFLLSGNIEVHAIDGMGKDKVYTINAGVIKKIIRHEMENSQIQSKEIEKKLKKAHLDSLIVNLYKGR